jgi:para-aminobenzoate synthetase/4-amino-4-deoxychorismate lyase
MEPRLRPLLKRASGPLAWFGLYKTCTICKGLSFLEDAPDTLLHASKPSTGRSKYHAKLAAIRRLIQAGEVYQINFTTRVRLQAKYDAWKLFGALFRRHPVPYAAFLNAGAEQIVSLSPELFFQIDRGHITVKPMKGTAPRGRLLEDDMISAEELRTSPKNRAENVMIVDLMRNDLGRICRTGSVETPKLFEVERYPTLWQMTSTVEGELIEGCTVESIVRALFPSGSVTGAPKIRAMEHIAALEDSPRGVYTGAIGFFAPKRAGFSVAIRTIALHKTNGTMGVGGGITYDSVASTEWEECQWKAAFLVQSQPDFKILETMYWMRKYRFLDAHLKRMKDSAAYFGFRFEERRARVELQKLASRFRMAPQRVRLTLSKEGDMEITHADCIAERFGRVGISSRRVSSQDRFLFHKTTNRSMYEQELAVARKRKLDDVVFFNERGELTEGTIHNVFLVKGNVWRTPAVACGLLPGVFRARILKKRPNSCEAILGLDDLKHADAVYLCNSVRGIFEVKVDWSRKTSCSARVEEPVFTPRIRTAYFPRLLTR